jgi:hypothetical protein
VASLFNQVGKFERVHQQTSGEVLWRVSQPTLEQLFLMADARESSCELNLMMCRMQIKFRFLFHGLLFVNLIRENHGKRLDHVNGETMPMPDQLSS